MSKIYFIFFLVGLTFFCCAQEYNSVVISEIMADPTPIVGLPEAEYLELYNRSDKTISLKGWKLTTGTRSSVLPDSLLLPGAYIILCQRNNMTSLSGYGKVLGMNSLSLTNDGMSLQLYNPANKLVYAVSYVIKWWDPDKRGGGFSLEMADTERPCMEAGNWFTSVDVLGGTPGKPNSLVKNIKDSQPPSVERVDVQDNGQLIVVFNKRMDSLNTVLGAIVNLEGRNIIKKQLDLPSFRSLRLTLDSPLLKGQDYRLSIQNAADCAGNLLRESLHRIGLPSPADSGDIVINEILFNPRDSGVDFVELYNKSSKFINLKSWTIGNLKTDGTSAFNIITSADVLIAPYSFLALTTDVIVLKEEYPSAMKADFLEVPSLPSFPNEEGGVILRSAGSVIFDRFIYSEKMHHELLSGFNGVSLEKSDPNVSSALRSNWQSASSVTGYATPGFANSQKTPEKQEDYFILKPEAFTPDNDGQDDFAILEFHQKLAGQIATIRIFSLSGNLVRNLLRNQLIGTAGEIKWDGTDESGQVVPTGYYLFLIDVFDVTGKTQQYKKRVVVARREG